MEDPEFDAEFDYKLEFSRIQKLFVFVISKEVIVNTGLFYYGNDTTHKSPSQGFLSTQVCLLHRTPDVSLTDGKATCSFIARLSYY